MKQILAWHFVGDTLRDGSAIPEDGEWLKVKTPLSLCNHGLHASLNPFAALQYAPGATLCRVALRGEIVHGDDKLCASERMIICRMDATELLRYFARMQALSVVHLYDAPDVVLDYLMTGDEGIRAAARDAARAAALGAARAAALDAAWEAALDAARVAALDAARAAALDAAWEAARAAALDAAKKEFTAFVHECFGV
jgi:hypothetical protein